MFAQRITYVGEFGYELYAEEAHATAVWDALLAAGAEHGIRVCGYRALDGLRMEKGYRYIGTDLTPSDTPDQAGLGHTRQSLQGLPPIQKPGCTQRVISR